MTNYGPIINYTNLQDAQKLIGQEVVFSNSLRVITECPNIAKRLILNAIDKNSDYPFQTQRKNLPLAFQFVRKIIKEE